MALNSDIKFVAGVGEARAKLLALELGIHTLGDMLYNFPFRYIDRTQIYPIAQVGASEQSLVQIRGRVIGVSYMGEGAKRRFMVSVADKSGTAELLWFHGVKWIEKQIEVGREYLIFGRPSLFNGALSMVHPEVETIEKAFSRKAESGMHGIYSSTEMLS
ncbi:MAG: OB-fold nucleic acid binding domain-containing protein, partial [Rikenellaceae bacterium]